MRRRHHGMQGHVVGQPGAVDRGIDIAGGEKRRQGGGETQALALFSKVERLDAEPVAAQGDAAAVALMDNESEHAVKAPRRLDAPGVPGLGHHLGVAVGEEAIAQRFEFAAQLAVIVDAAVEDQGQAERRIAHRLRPALAQIDDLQPPVAEGDPALCNDAFAIRPPWRLPGRHPGNRAGICRASIKGKLAAQTAHISMNSPGLFEAHRPMRAAPG